MSQEELHDSNLIELIKCSGADQAALLNLYHSFRNAQGGSLPWVREYDAYKRILQLRAEKLQMKTKLKSLLYASMEIRMWVRNWEMPMDNDPEWVSDYANFDEAISKATGEA